MDETPTNLVSAVEKPNVYEEDGVWIYRASAVGGCSKALVAARLGYDPLAPPEAQQARFDDGHMHEVAIIEKMEKKGFCLERRQERVNLPVSNKVLVRGHIDWIGALDDGVERVWDAKSMSKDSYAKWLAKRWDGADYFGNYAIQLSIYMAATKLPGGLLAKNKDSGALDFFTFDEPPVPIAQIKAKILKVESIARKGILPEKCDKTNFPCPYFFLHEDPEVVAREVVVENELEQAIMEYEMARARESVAKEDKDNARDLIVELLSGREEVATPTHKIKYTMTTRNTFDKKSFEAEHPDIPIDVFYTQSSSPRLTVENLDKQKKKAGKKS